MVIDLNNRTCAVALLLREASRAIDDMWRVASSEGTYDAVYLAEASQDVHRALIALGHDESRVADPPLVGSEAFVG